MDDSAIQVKNVSKNFALPHEKAKSIKEVFVSPFKTAMHKNVSVQHALKNVSFDIKKGEFFGIVGRNGSGKSTLLKMIAGIYQPSKGTVRVNGKLVPFIELGVGFNPELTGRENVYLNGALLGFSKKEIEAMYDDIVGFSELGKFMDQKLKNYSSGMQVRLAFSVATRAKADVLLVDEVLAVGDADFQRKCFDYFRKLKKENITVIFVTHNMDAVREYCDRALLIDKSEVVFEGSAQAVASRYSKLFTNTEGGTGTDRSDQERWGEGGARFVKPRFQKNADDHVELSFMIEADEDADEVVIGYYVTNAQGQNICGTNTQLLEYKVPPLGAGKKYKGSFVMPNIFSDGRYSVSLALQKNNGDDIMDWWVNPVQLQITKASHVPYLIDLPVKTKIQEASTS
jgi:ABC-2 type transport system ATP-binding protein